MKFLSIATSLALVSAEGHDGHDHSDSHHGHDHSSLKPTGPFYGILTKPNAKGDKIWNEMEVQFNFGESSFDMVWWFGMRIPLVDKQIFKCDGVPFEFDEDNLKIVLHPNSNPCLKAISDKFVSLGLADPFFLAVDHDSGDITFKAHEIMAPVMLYAIETPLEKIPSGENGLAPLNNPARRAKHDHDHGTAGPDHDHNHATAGPCCGTTSANSIPVGAAAKGNGVSYGSSLTALVTITAGLAVMFL